MYDTLIVGEEINLVYDFPWYWKCRANQDIDKLKNLDLWIVGLLRHDSHISHASFNEIIEHINYLKPKV